jgi:hypothetical protein
MGSSSSSSGGIGFVGLLTIVFIALKLTGYISWSWWWITSPVWITTIVVIACLIVLALIEAASHTSKRRRTP